MTQTSPPPRSIKGPASLSAALAAALIASFALYEDTAVVPYRDPIGILTVCGGVTGPDVIEGKTYTQADCTRIRTLFFERFNAGVTACIRVPIAAHEHFAFLHFTWNVGIRAFCQSTLVAKLNRQDYAGACAQLSRWVYVRGRDCRIKANNCRGIVFRRTFERAACEGKLSIPGLT